MNPTVYDFRNPRTWEELLFCWLLFGMFNINPDKIRLQQLPSTSCSFYGTLMLRVFVVALGSVGVFLIGRLVGTGLAEGHIAASSFLGFLLLTVLILINAALDVPWSVQVLSEVRRGFVRGMEVLGWVVSPITKRFNKPDEDDSPRIGNAIADALSDIHNRVCRPISIVSGEYSVDDLRWTLQEWQEYVGELVHKAYRDHKRSPGKGAPLLCQDTGVTFMSVQMYERLVRAFETLGYGSDLREEFDRLVKDTPVMSVYIRNLRFPDGSPVPALREESQDENLILLKLPYAISGGYPLLVTNHSSVPVDGAVLRAHYGDFDHNGNPVLESIPFPAFEMPVDISNITKGTEE